MLQVVTLVGEVPFDELGASFVVYSAVVLPQVSVVPEVFQHFAEGPLRSPGMLS